MGLRRLQSFVCSVPILRCLSMLLLLHTASQKNALASTRLGRNETDHFALLSIKAQITHNSMLTTSSWNDSLHFCQWKGVLCGRRHQRVTGLNLQSYNLAGSISPAIGNLSFLKVVDLTNNSFQVKFLMTWVGYLGYKKFIGDLTKELDALSILEVLNIESNNLTGVIPASFRNLSSLELLLAKEKMWEGSIPASLGPVEFVNLKNLSILSLSSCSGFGTGDVNDLNFISTCSKLRGLYLYDNGFGGVLPNSIANFSTEFQHLLVGGNQIS
ncbi:hypothetical protein Acr_27g0000390 [Actinidia rufa]|uniref:Leucine-rich repeat-containing N-terminal plant-type domain-containing protein n=1 Tax=Actinidia rufa TaxID=165716 RepID=A0A7J0H5D2_9ERIC|nr:hypothetical protein Acr_27g0000390 [Actinidia rufa]